MKVEMTRYRRIKPRHLIETLTKQTHPGFFDPHGKSKARDDKKQELAAKGYDALWFKEETENERIHVWGRHPSQEQKPKRTHRPYTLASQATIPYDD
jgi:hypothetical protein